jgi:ribosomal protein S18 acetylase RimI-like enzyme
VSDTPQAYEALCRIVLPDERVLLQSREPIQPVPGLTLTSVGLVHQMILTRQGLDYSGGDEIVHLGKRDALDMLELATKTKPGPFFARTHETGHYIGVRHQGRLVAMAGERMRIDGYVEISAVCVDEAWRGKGLARRLIAVLSRRIQQTGLIPFLHVFSHNSSALALYERLGFVSRGTFHITMASNHVSHPGHTITDQIDR